MSDIDIYQIYIDAFLANLPEWITKEKGSTIRAIAEAQAKATVEVLTKLEEAKR